MGDDQASKLKFDALMTKLRAHPGGLEAFIADPLPMLQNERIPLVTEDEVEGNPGRFVIQDNTSGRGIRAHGALASTDPAKLWFETSWWGVSICINDKFCKNLSVAAAPVGLLTGAVTGGLVAGGLAAGPAAASIGAAIGAVLGLKVAELLIVNNGNGVYFPVSWPQWVPLIVCSPFVPVELAAVAVLLHPVRM